MTFSLYIHFQMDTWVTSTFYLFLLMLLCTWVYQYLFDLCFQFFWHIPGSAITRSYSRLTLFQPSIFYWSIINLQCCISFKYTPKWFSYLYALYIYIFFFKFFSIVGYYKILNIVSCIIWYILIVYIYFIYK